MHHISVVLMFGQILLNEEQRDKYHILEHGTRKLMACIDDNILWYIKPIIRGRIDDNSFKCKTRGFFIFLTIITATCFPNADQFCSDP